MISIAFGLWMSILGLGTPQAWTEHLDDPLLQQLEKASSTGLAATLEDCRLQLKARLGQAGTATNAEYNVAYADWRLAQLLMGQNNDKERIDTLLKEAQTLLEEAKRNSPEDPEVLSLLSGVLGLRIGQSMMRGMRLGPRAGNLLDKAARLAPENPRVALQKGISAFHTPRLFGGGVKKAEKHLRQAVDLFAREPLNAAWPNWGRIDALTWLGQALAKRGNKEEARQVYQQALELEPDMGWIRFVLLPALEKE